MYVLDSEESTPTLLGRETAEKLKVIVFTTQVTETSNDESSFTIKSIEQEIYDKYSDVFKK